MEIPETESSIYSNRLRNVNGAIGLDEQLMGFHTMLWVVWALQMRGLTLMDCQFIGKGKSKVSRILCVADKLVSVNRGESSGTDTCRHRSARKNSIHKLSP